MKNLKKQGGITLVALVVTIVVLLILAGITIMYVLQGNSVFNSAEDAKVATHEANVKESVAIALYSVQTEYYNPNGSIATATGDNADAIKTAKIAAANTVMTTDLAKNGIAPKTDATTPFAITAIENASGAFEVTAAGDVTYNSVAYTVTINGSSLVVTPVTE